MKADNNVDAEDLKVNLLTQEIKFAKMLAGNEFNVAIKEKHIKKLANWLKNRSACSQVFSDKDCLRIWKGLFYSMWMSDKPLPQESLATKIASLLHSFDRIESSLQFFAMFLKTMAIEWGGIDQWRIDKFMMLVRKVTREMLHIIQSKNWDADAIEQLTTRLDETVLGAGTPRGLFMHFIELFFEEVGKVSNGDIEADVVTLLLKPFMQYVAAQNDFKLIHCVTKHVFNYLLFQSEAGREYKEKFDAWKAMGFPGNSLDDLVLETPEEDDESEADSDESEEEADEAEDGDDDSNGPKALDPRAGRVDVVMPEIKFSPLEIANALEDLKYKKFTRVRNRKAIDRIVSSYKKFAGGEFPLGIQRLKIDREDLQLPDTEDKAIEIMAFEDKLLEKTRALKKVNKRKRKKILASEPSQSAEFQSKSNKMAKIKHNANTWMEEDMTPDDVDSNVAAESRPIKKAKKSKVIEEESLNGFVGTDEVTQSKPGKKHKQPKQLEDTADHEDADIAVQSPAKKHKHSKQINGTAEATDDTPSKVSPKFSAIKHKQAKDANGTADLPSVESNATPKLSAKKPKKSKELNGTLVSASEVKTPTGTPKKVKSKPSTPQSTIDDANGSQSKIVETPKNKKPSEWDAPLEDGETEYFIPSKKAKANGVQSTTVTKATPSPSAKKQKVKSPKSAQSTPQMDRVAALKSSTPKSALSSAEKKVKIVLQMNKSQEATEYIRQLKQSPNLPFDSNKKPLKGVLKPNLMPSPINPFYKKMIGLK